MARGQSGRGATLPRSPPVAAQIRHCARRNGGASNPGLAHRAGGCSIVNTQSQEEGAMPQPIALYARVSTSEQHVEPQLHALCRYAQDRGVEAVEYVDHGVSGAKDSRPALDALM